MHGDGRASWKGSGYTRGLERSDFKTYGFLGHTLFLDSRICMRGTRRERPAPRGTHTAHTGTEICRRGRADAFSRVTTSRRQDWAGRALMGENRPVSDANMQGRPHGVKQDTTGARQPEGLGATGLSASPEKQRRQRGHHPAHTRPHGLRGTRQPPQTVRVLHDFCGLGTARPPA